MLLFVGLGNPTPDSENNRHNVGFKIIDSINKKFGLSKQKPKFKGLLTTGNVGNQKVYAIKPLTFMNNSGICIRELIEYFKIDAEDVIVFHDDLDVEFGKIKAKFGGSSAGHNGIASIDKFIGKDYSRVRIGIGKPKENIEVGDFVLQNFEEEELAGIEKKSQDDLISDEEKMQLLEFFRNEPAKNKTIKKELQIKKEKHRPQEWMRVMTFCIKTQNPSII